MLFEDVSLDCIFGYLKEFTIFERYDRFITFHISFVLVHFSAVFFLINDELVLVCWQNANVCVSLLAKC